MSDTPDEITIVAELDGETHTASCLPGQVLLEALEDAGLEPPFSCRAGACAACMCKLVEGRVELLDNHVLDESDLAEGWILGCQAVPQTEHIKISYDESQ